MTIVIVLGSLVVYYLLSRRAPGADTSGSLAVPARYYVVVPALNEERVLANTLDSLIALHNDRLRILVIDDASSDATCAVAAAYRRRHVEVLQRCLPDARLGKGAALNHAVSMIARAVAREGLDPAQVVVGVVDADGRLSPNTLDVLDDMFRDPGLGAVQTLVRIINRHTVLGRFQDYEFVAFSSLTQSARVHLGSVALGGNGQFTRLSALVSVGGRPWTDCLTEDLDLGIRIAIEGWRISYTSRAHVEQQGLTDVRRLVRQRTRWAHGHFQCWRLLPAILGSDLPHLAAFDLCFYLLAPAIVLAAPILFVVPLAVMVSRPEFFHALSPTGAAVFGTVMYLFSFGPALLLTMFYRRRAGDLSRRRALLLGHTLAVYNFIWYVATWRAVWRIVSRRQQWEKTERVVETQPPWQPELRVRPALTGTATLVRRPPPPAPVRVFAGRHAVVAGRRYRAVVRYRPRLAAR